MAAFRPIRFGKSSPGSCDMRGLFLAPSFRAGACSDGGHQAYEQIPYSEDCLMPPRRFLVTGGAGFLGSSLAIGLRRRWPDSDVVALDNLKRRGSELQLSRLAAEGVRFVHGDIRNAEDFEAIPSCDVLLECSAEPSVMAGYDGTPRYVLNTNLFGTMNCLEHARRCGSSIVFFSTSRVYPMAALNGVRFVEGDTRFSWTDDQIIAGVSSRGVTEAFPLHGARSLYGMTKLASEMLLEEYAHAYGVKAIINRCGVLAGPWQMGKIDQGILAYWVARHHFQLPLKYIGFGGLGKQVRDFLHVDDVVSLVMEQISQFEMFQGEIFNVGGGPAMSASLAELTALCRRATGNALDIGHDSTTRMADIRVYVTDSTKLHARTSWRPTKSVEIMVDDLARWIRDDEATLKRVLA
jgi:CDP-paratose 2-epimerase